VFRFDDCVLRGLLATSLVLTCATVSARTASRVGGEVTPGNNARVRVIVQTPDAQKLALRLNKCGGFVYRNLPLIGSVAIEVPANALGILSRSPLVKHVSVDDSVRKTDLFTVESSGASIAWGTYGLTGRGIGVAVLDSGVSFKDDFRLGADGSRILAKVNFSPDAKTTNDLAGHGTHVAGILAGDGTLSTGPNCFQTFYGIAPEANVINLRVLDAQGVGLVSQVVAAVQWVVRHQSALNIRVLNLSVGHPVGESYQTDPLCVALEQAWRKGIVVVCAAGNEGRLNTEPRDGLDNGGYGTAYGSVQSPGNSPYVITVGAMKRFAGTRVGDTIASYSGRGPSRIDFVAKPDIVAPGNRVVSTQASGSTLDQRFSATNGLPYTAYMFTSQTGMSQDYFVMSGTSMAAPVVSGAVALMLQKDPGLKPATAKARLMASADKWTNPDGTGDLFTYGSGYLNIPRALNSSVHATGLAKSPSVAKRENYNVRIVPTGSILNNAYIGSRLAVPIDLWGTRAMWGTGLTVAQNRAMWGTGFWDDFSTRQLSQTSIEFDEITLKGEGR
jgi:serine protease AprX